MSGPGKRSRGRARVFLQTAAEDIFRQNFSLYSTFHYPLNYKLHKRLLPTRGEPV